MVDIDLIYSLDSFVMIIFVNLNIAADLKHLESVYIIKETKKEQKYRNKIF